METELLLQMELSFSGACLHALEPVSILCMSIQCTCTCMTRMIVQEYIILFWQGFSHKWALDGKCYGLL